ncbi:class I SAM-dependent methyltransferase [Patescibacteria group bacterium AH-259-L05]|nr:class I SAM-dependent methyltransferase [Patescibacteria group bacterium AH-259-L05]
MVVVQILKRRFVPCKPSFLIVLKMLEYMVMKPEVAQKILQKNKQDWEAIAEKFSGTRQYIWSELTSLIKYVKDDDTVLDLGCGNGRLLELFKGRNVEYVGIDNSEKLIEIARQRSSKFKTYGLKFDFVVGDALDLPPKLKQFDVILAIAVFHHIPSKELRIQFLQNCWRVLKSNGFIIITVWNLYQTGLLFKYHTWPMIFGHRLKGLDFKDVFIPFQLPDRDIKRYYHTFTRSELKRLIKKAGFKVVKSYLARGNIIVIAKKP